MQIGKTLSLACCAGTAAILADISIVFVASAIKKLRHIRCGGAVASTVRVRVVADEHDVARTCFRCGKGRWKAMQDRCDNQCRAEDREYDGTNHLFRLYTDLETNERHEHYVDGQTMS